MKERLDDQEGHRRPDKAVGLFASALGVILAAIGAFTPSSTGILGTGGLF